MRCVGADETGLAGRRIRAKIATDVARGKSERAKAGDLEVREILTHAAALAEQLFGGGAHIGGFCIEGKILVNAGGEIKQRSAQGRPGVKDLRAYLANSSEGLDAGRFELKLIGR